jgi:hypothetical protein
LVENPALHPFEDASCRREPDLEHVHPAITAICRVEKFAPRLRQSDRVVYLARRSRYTGHVEPCWALVAALTANTVCSTHAEGAVWYHGRDLVLPSNCMIDGTEPRPVEETGGYPRGIRSLRAWDFGYRQRAREHPSFVVTDPILVELDSPAVVTRAALVRIFDRVPGTQTPPAITETQFDQLVEMGRAAPDGRLGRPR